MIPTENLRLIIMASQLCVIENEMSVRRENLKCLLRLGFDPDSPEVEAVKDELRALYDTFRSQEDEYLTLERSLER